MGLGPHQPQQISGRVCSTHQRTITSQGCAIKPARCPDLVPEPLPGLRGSCGRSSAVHDAAQLRARRSRCPSSAGTGTTIHAEFDGQILGFAHNFAATMAWSGLSAVTRQMPVASTDPALDEKSVTIKVMA